MRETTATGIAAPRSKAANIGLWVLQIAGAAVFLMAGSSKLMSDPTMVTVFGNIGLGQWFRYLTGTLEVLGGIGLLIPRLAGLAALMLAAVMIGAVLTHLFVLGGSPALPLALLVAMAIVAWARREAFTRFLGR